MATNIMMVTRGDTISFNIEIEDENSYRGRYRLTENDAVYFGLMLPHQPFEDAIIKRKFVKADQDSSGNVYVTFTPEESAMLLPGVYYYAVKLRQNINSNNELITTIISKTKFVVND